MDATTTLLLFGLTLIFFLIPTTLYPVPIMNYLRRKKLLYDVTFALYMLTPGERFAVNSVFFLSIALLVLATVLYLPEHIMTISHRVYYYIHGSHMSKNQIASASSALVQQVGSSPGSL